MLELPQLLNRLVKTQNKLVYAARPFVRHSDKPLFLALIGPSGAGKDTVKQKLLHSARFYSIRTATNRQRRKDEPETDYFWMRPKHENEPENAYLRHLIKEYDLFEYDYHYGSMYGTPVKSIKEAFASGKIPLYCSENQGALFMEKHLAPVSDVLIVMLVPDNFIDMEKRIFAGNRNNPTRRLKESFEKLREAPNVAHYVVINPADSVEKGKSGIESAVKAVKQVVMSIV